MNEQYSFLNLTFLKNIGCKLGSGKFRGNRINRTVNYNHGGPNTNNRHSGPPVGCCEGHVRGHNIYNDKFARTGSTINQGYICGSGSRLLLLEF